MRTWAWVRKVLTLVLVVLFAMGVMAGPALAKGSSFSSGSRSFSAPKPSTSSGSSRSFSSPKPSTSTPSAPSKSSPSYSSPSKTYSSPSKSYSSPSSPSYSSGDRSYSSPNRSFSIPKPSIFGSKSSGNSSTGSSTAQQPQPTYDPSTTRYPTRPPVIIYGSSPYDSTYWHDYYYGMPWYWRLLHRPVYSTVSGWAWSWVPVVAAGLGLWILLGILSSAIARRRRH